jgi:hypothetical protein
MKKGKRIEKKRRMKEAYYNELRKQNVIDNTSDKENLENFTKEQLISKLNDLGIEAKISMKKDELLILLQNSKQVEESTNKNEEEIITDNNSTEKNIEEIEIEEVEESQIEEESIEEVEV